jgi:serine/threonine protein kinase
LLAASDIPNICEVIPDSLVNEVDMVSFDMIRIHPSQTLDDLVGWKNEISLLDPELACDYFKQLLRIVKSCHKFGFVHRDIKPNNILVSNNEIYLIDFGLAGVVDDYEYLIPVEIEDTITGAYWSGFRNALVSLPEFALGDDDIISVRDYRSDIAQAVAVFYYMLTGEKNIKMLDRETPTLNELTLLNTRDCYLITKGLQSFIDDRFQTVDEIYEILDSDRDIDSWMEEYVEIIRHDHSDLRVGQSHFVGFLTSFHPISVNPKQPDYEGSFETNHIDQPVKLKWKIHTSETNKYTVHSMTIGWPFSWQFTIGNIQSAKVFTQSLKKSFEVSRTKIIRYQ